MHRIIARAVLFVLSSALILHAQPAFVISTVAGNGTAGFSGDSGLATNAQLYNPIALAVDSVGNLYIADQANNRIRKMTPEGVISTVAGNGNAGYSGDGGPATAATLNNPSGVFVNANGELFIGDAGNHVVRKISAGGTITTISGGGVQGDCGDNGPAYKACMGGPADMVADSVGNLFLVDSGNDIIRRVDTTTLPYITTVAGEGAPGYSGDGGKAVAAFLNNPGGIAFSPAGDLFIADTGNHVIRKVSNGIITTFAGNGNADHTGDGGPAINASMISPTGIRFDPAGNLYLTDTTNANVRLILTDGRIFTVAGNGNGNYAGDNGPATVAGLYPKGIAVAPSGVIYIADTGNQRIRALTPAGLGISGLVFPIVADGGGWQTTLGITNTTTTAATATAQFFQTTDASGDSQPWTLPLTQAVSTQNMQLAPGATAFLQTPGTASMGAQGFGNLVTSPGVQAFAVVAMQVPGSANQSAMVPATAPGTQILVPFDNSPGVATSITVVNTSGFPETLSANLLLTASGQSVPGTLPSVPALGQTTFSLPTLLPQSAGQQGTLELASNGGTFSVVAFRVDPTGAFTSLPVYVVSSAPF